MVLLPDMLVIFYAAFATAIACAVFCLGKIAAGAVWGRARKILDENPLSQEILMPYATTTETLMIVFAVMLRSPIMLVLAIYREVRLEPWERSPRIREIDFNNRSCTDLLGSVCNMITGYPERAHSFYARERGNARAIECARIIQTHDNQSNSLLNG